MSENKQEPKKLPVDEIIEGFKDGKFKQLDFNKDGLIEAAYTEVQKEDKKKWQE